MPQLHYDVHDGSGPYLLMMHGMLSSRAQWMLNLEALAEVCRPVVAELWAHGRSPSPEDPALYGPDSYVAQFEAIRADLGAEHWFVCGQSFGAGLTLRYSLDHPDRVLGQIFTNSRSALADAEFVRLNRANADKRAHLLRDHGREGLKKIPVHPIKARRLPAQVKEALVADAELHDPAGFALTFQHSSPYLSVRERAHETKVPTLLVVGEREEVFRPSREFAEAVIAGLEIAATPAGHAVNIESAEIFNQAVAAFIRKHQP